MFWWVCTRIPNCISWAFQQVLGLPRDLSVDNSLRSPPPPHPPPSFRVLLLLNLLVSHHFCHVIGSIDRLLPSLIIFFLHNLITAAKCPSLHRPIVKRPPWIFSQLWFAFSKQAALSHFLRSPLRLILISFVLFIIDAQNLWYFNLTNLFCVFFRIQDWREDKSC